jgi:ADP-heptose:LPS heptosyltransferase
VGLVWQAGDWAPQRSIPVALLRPLAAVPGVTWRVLQRGAAVPGWLGTPDGSDDVAELAGLMTGLDLVISVDTMPAHLAGALGVPVWTLLAEPADWRWMEGREDTPWYPAMRLIRQPVPGDWAPVIARVAADLAAIASMR